jgi:hypothetical protein
VSGVGEPSRFSGVDAAFNVMADATRQLGSARLRERSGQTLPGLLRVIGPAGLGVSFGLSTAGLSVAGLSAASALSG